MHDAIYAALSHYTECEGADFYNGEIKAAAGQVPNDPGAALEAVARLRGLRERDEAADMMLEIGRASCRERVCQYVEISVGAGPLKKKHENIQKNTNRT